MIGMPLDAEPMAPTARTSGAQRKPSVRCPWGLRVPEPHRAAPFGRDAATGGSATCVHLNPGGGDMRKPVLFALVGVSVLLLGSTAVLYQKYRQSSSDLASTKSVEETTRAHYGEAINSIATIQDSLDAIVL